MKLRSTLLAVGLLMSACGSAEPANQTGPQRTAVGEEGVTPLSPFAEILLTALAASAPKQLSSGELCDNAGMCTEEGKADIDDLVRRGLVTHLPSGSYALTETGHRYIDTHFRIVRNGDTVSFESRTGGDR